MFPRLLTPLTWTSGFPLACYLYTPGTAHRDELQVQWSGLRGMSALGTGLGCG